MFARSRHLLAAAVIALLLGAALYLGIAGGALRAAFGLALLLFLPGYAWAEALFPSGALRMAERVALSFGLSLALVITGGLVLNATAWGLQARSWAVLSTCVILAGVLVAFVRRVREVGMPALVARRHPVRPPEAALIGLALLLAGAAGVISLRAVAQQEATDFTQLWVQQTGPSTVLVGMANREPNAETYRLELRAGTALVKAWSLVGLQPGQQWQASVAVPAGNGDHMVQAVLYREAAPNEPYRRVQLWLNQVASQ